MSAILDFYDLDQFYNYMNGFPDLKSPNSDPKHDFLSGRSRDYQFSAEKGSHFHFRHFWSIQ